jgi:hypothetical protein
VNRDDRAKFLGDLRRKGSLREVERKFRTRRGTVRAMLVSGEIIEVNREPHILGLCFDITERKQAEAELLRTLDREKELGGCVAFLYRWCRTSFAPRWVSSKAARRSTGVLRMGSMTSSTFFEQEISTDDEKQDESEGRPKGRKTG